MNHSDQEMLLTVKVLKAFLFSLPIFVFTIHNFPKSITAINVSLIQRLPHNVTVARLLYKFAYSLVKYSQMLLKNWHFSKETFLLESIKIQKIMN